MNKDQNEGFRQFRRVGILTTIPFILLMGPLLGFLAGRWVDQRFDLFPLVTIILIILGFAASIRETVRIVREMAGS